MRQRVSFVTLGVADVGRARAFYERLGWRASSSSKPNVAFFDAGGVVFSLFGRADLAKDACVDDTPPGFSGVALAHNVAAKEDVAATLEEAEAAGARILKPAQDVFWGGHAGYFADPDGHLWEVAWNPFMPLDENGVPRLPD
ncbi:MAG TPA: VOC family protein [Azospirillaceae bacterium]|nr:VOC family protein [Azospirillaceae bacterium]